MRNGTDAVRGLLALASVMAVFALPPFLVTAIHARTVARLSLVEAMVGTATIAAKGHWSDPRAAYPAHAREKMPNGAAWWLCLALPLGATAIIGAIVAAPLDVATSRRKLARRGYDPRGSRPREWARPRDLKPLWVPHRSGKRLTLGTLDGRLLATDPEAMTLLCAAPRSGKTRAYIIPWLLEHDGPALVTSTKRDVWKATAERRERGGPVWMFDPMSPGSCCWDPLEGCESWSRALRQARWLANSASHPGPASHIEDFWGIEASKLLAPLLHAAAVSGASIGQVLTWLESNDRTAPTEILKSDGEPAAQSQLEGVLALDPRNTGTTYMSTAHLLHAYRHPEVLATAKPGFTATDLLDGDAPTLYLASSSTYQEMLAPILVALVSSVIEAAIEKSRADDTPLDPLLRILLDETANIAPLQTLPSHLADVAAYGIRIATVWQNIAQTHNRYGDAANIILGASSAKIFLGDISEPTTHATVVGLLGQQPIDIDDHSTLGPKALPQDLQQFPKGRALVISGSLPPTLVRYKHYSQIKW